MDKYLFDSDVVIWFLKNREKEVKLVEDLTKIGNIYCSVITIAEVRAGLTKRPENVVKQLKNIFLPLDTTFEIAEQAGAFKQKYRLDIADMLIAATATIFDLTFVTYNKKHFPMPEVRLYAF